MCRNVFLVERNWTRSVVFRTLVWGKLAKASGKPAGTLSLAAGLPCRNAAPVASLSPQASVECPSRLAGLNTSTEVLIAHLKLEIEKLRRTLYGSRSEHT